MSLSKEAILESYIGNPKMIMGKKSPNTADSIFEAMDVFAKQEAIEFTIFCGSNSLGFNSEMNKWLFNDTTGRYNFSTNEMYDLFKQQQSKTNS